MAKDTSASIRTPMTLSSLAMILVIMGQDFDNITFLSGLVIFGAISLIVTYVGYYFYLRHKERRANDLEKEGS